MKFLTFVDLHEDKKQLKHLVARASEDDVDFIICSGGLHPVASNIKLILGKINSIGKKAFFICSNEKERNIVSSMIGNYENCFFLDGEAIEHEDYVLFGHGGEGLAREDFQFRQVSRKWYGNYKNKKSVLVLYGPAYETKLDKVEDKFLGNIDYRKFILRMQPKVAISGHITESYGMSDKLEKTILINPGFEGMVIELP
jgi:Icc-related predicted phosphoesterase